MTVLLKALWKVEPQGWRATLRCSIRLACTMLWAYICTHTNTHREKELNQLHHYLKFLKEDCLVKFQHWWILKVSRIINRQNTPCTSHRKHLNASSKQLPGSRALRLWAHLELPRIWDQTQSLCRSPSSYRYTTHCLSAARWLCFKEKHRKKFAVTVFGVPVTETENPSRHLSCAKTVNVSTSLGHSAAMRTFFRCHEHLTFE